MTPIRRRRFLQALGLGAGATLLGPLVSRFASAAGPTCRFLFVVEGNCYEPITALADEPRAAIDATLSEPLGDRRWWYRRYAHDTPLISSTRFDTAPALGALASNPAVAAQTGVVFGLSSKIAGGGHSAFHGALASARTVSGVPGGQTIDALLAGLPGVRREAPYDAIRLAVAPSGSGPIDFGLCAYGQARAAPVILQPRAAYDALFGSVSGDGATFGRRRSLLDYASEDVSATLAAFPGNSDERAKLESYLESVEDLTARHERLLALEDQLRAHAPPPPDENPLHMSDDPLEHFRAHLELATAAFRGGLTNVAVVGCGTGSRFDLSYTSVSPDVRRHDLHHSSGGSAELRRRIHEVTRLQVEAIAAVAADLAATPETGADGSMLDHTVIVFVGDNGEQHHSTASEFPVVLIGGSAMGLSTAGRTVVYPGLDSGGHRQLSNLWNTLGHVAGAELDDFGAEGPSRRALGPLSELMG